MSIDVTTEKRFESDIEAAFLSSAGGYTKGTDAYDPNHGLYVNTLIDFIQTTQPKEWARFEKQNQVDPIRKFCLAFNNACEADGLLSVLRHGFKHRGITFHVCYFKPESALNQTAAERYARNRIDCYRQWYYSADTKKSVDMVLTVNGIPVFAFELKNQYTGQNVENAKLQWINDRDQREVCFQFNRRILGFFCVDHTEVWMTTKLAGKDTYFLPFNQGSNGAGQDGGKGNPPNPDGYPTAYLWEQVFQKDSMMDILQKFLHLQVKEEKKPLPEGTVKTVRKQALIFPRYHQLDVVRKLLADVSAHGAGRNYLSKQNGFMKELAKLLGLGEDATEEQIMEGLKACLEENKSLKETAEAGKQPPAEDNKVVANKEVCELLGLKAGAATADVAAAIMALKGGIVGGVNLAEEVKGLKAQLADRDAEEAVKIALKAGKITPAQREWAKNYALKNLDDFKGFVEKAPQVVPMGDVGGSESLTLKGCEPDEATMLVCKQLGISAEDVKKYGMKGD